MEGKQQIVTGLNDIYRRWKDLLASLSEDQILTPLEPSTWTVKDVVAHLWAWQQGSVARMEAALDNREPDYPDWWKKNGPNPEENLDKTNAWIYKANRDKPWAGVYENWKTQFEHYVELTKRIPEEDLLELGKYSWLGKYALSASAMGSLEHHEEHYDTLRLWLEQHDIDWSH